METVFLLQVNNGQEYDDFEEWTEGVYRTTNAAKKAYQEYIQEWFGILVDAEWDEDLFEGEYGKIIEYEIKD